MPIKRMLVDATHPEETRIVVTSGNRLEEFDFESASRRQLRGNIYLAKVTRVEPSLQAAFIEYGGNRHGFLAFSEIHPDYYQIPVADREALLAAEEREEASEAAAADAVAAAGDDSGAPDDSADGEASEGDGHVEEAGPSDETVDNVGGGDALEEVTERRKPRARQYKIQEVIKRRQVMLVQVVKEERGNKGAALTTYLSLAGRYSVLMPNTARGGGISRKITNSTDRKRLKEIAGDLEVPHGMGVILRTAGAARTKAEVKRDFEYLMRLWENVRSLTLKSQAPCLVYEEGSLIKRTIRDLYNKEIDEVWVSGEAAYRESKDFMRMIMPSHAKNVQLYKEPQPLFSKYAVEPQLDSMFSPQVTLPSGGYIVINPTEALVSIDVNSGRATREHNIEDTAVQTNLEAAEEVARQLRLRDLAGLIVIDFIDMMDKRSIRNVERRLKDALKNDRARIQVGRISHFGLLEMSRQRIRFGVVESSTHVCPTCQGAGIVRSVESLALMVMRAVEDHVLRRAGQSINVRVPIEVALYILNAKRQTLADLEIQHALSITVVADAKIEGSHFQIEKGEAREIPVDASRARHVRVDSAEMSEYVEEDEEVEAEAEEADADAPVEAGSSAAPAADDQEGRSRRRRRRRGGRDRQDQEERPAASAGTSEDEAEGLDAAEAGEGDEEDVVRAETGEDGEGPRRRRRRGRRGGRRNRRTGTEDGAVPQRSDDHEARTIVEGSADVDALEADVPSADLDSGHAVTAAAAEAELTANAPSAGEPVARKAPAAKRTGTRRAGAARNTSRTAAKTAEPEAPATMDADAGSTEAHAADTAPADATADAAPEKKARKPRAPRKAKSPAAAAMATEEPATADGAEPQQAPAAPVAAANGDARNDEAEITSSSGSADDDSRPKKGGWWQRRLGLS